MTRRDDLVGVDIDALVSPGPPPRNETAARATHDAARLVHKGRPARSSQRLRRWSILALVCCITGTATTLWLTRPPGTSPDHLAQLTAQPATAWTRTTTELVPSLGQDERVEWGVAAAVGAGTALVGTVVRQDVAVHVPYTSQNSTDKVPYRGSQGMRHDDRHVAALLSSDGTVQYTASYSWNQPAPLVVGASLVEFTGSRSAQRATIRDGETGEISTSLDLGSVRLVAAGSRGERAYLLLADRTGWCTLHQLDVRVGTQRQLGDGVGNCASDVDPDRVAPIAVGERIGVLPADSRVFDVSSGEVLWKKSTGWITLLPHDYLQVVDFAQPRNSGVYDAERRLLVRTTCSAVTVVAGGPGGDVAVTSRCGEPDGEGWHDAQGYRLESGEELWRRTDIADIVADADGHLLATEHLAGGGYSLQLVSLRPDTGQSGWRGPMSITTNQYVATDGSMALVTMVSPRSPTGSGELFAIDLGDGHVRWHVGVPSGGGPAGQLGQAAVVWVQPTELVRWNM